MMRVDLLLMYGLRDMVKQGNARGGSSQIVSFQKQKQVKTKTDVSDRNPVTP